MSDPLSSSIEDNPYSHSPLSTSSVITNSTFVLDTLILSPNNELPNSMIVPEQSMTNCVDDYLFSAVLSDDEKSEEKHAAFVPLKIPKDNQKQYKIKDTLKLNGYKLLEKMENTIQGCVIKAKNRIMDNIVVIKIANKKLSKKSATLNSKDLITQENILQEYNVIDCIGKHNPPKGFIKCIELFHDNKNIFIVEDFGGENLFEYVQKSFEMINNGEMTVKEWKTHAKILISQIIQYMSWLHNNVLTCHLDLSLENMVINGVEYDKTLKKFTNHGQISIIDFGVSDIFSPKNNYKCKKYVGKANYVSPQSYNKTEFNAKSNDIWSLGVCIFLILCGIPPYEIPDATNDDYFNLLIKGKMRSALKQWGFGGRLSHRAHDLLKKIFVINEEQRININGVIDHEYFKDINVTKYIDYGMKGYIKKKLNEFNRNQHYKEIFNDDPNKQTTQKYASDSINQYCRDFSKEINDRYFATKASDLKPTKTKHRRTTSGVLSKIARKNRKLLQSK